MILEGTSRREALARLLDELPREGLFSRSSILVETNTYFDGYLHDARCGNLPRTTSSVNSSRAALRRIDEWLESHDEYCLPAKILTTPARSGSEGRVALGWRVSFEEIVSLRSLLVTQLQLLTEPPTSAVDAFNRLAFPFSFSVHPALDVAALRNQAPASASLGWHADYLKYYEKNLEATISTGRAFPYAPLVEALAEIVNERRSRRGAPPVSADPSATVLIHDSDDLAYLGEEVAGAASYGSVRSAVRALFGARPGERVLSVPQTVAAFLNVAPGDQVVFDGSVPPAVLETVKVLFRPGGDGAYSDLSTAAAAAKELS